MEKCVDVNVDECVDECVERIGLEKDFMTGKEFADAIKDENKEIDDDGIVDFSFDDDENIDKHIDSEKNAGNGDKDDEPVMVKVNFELPEFLYRLFVSYCVFRQHEPGHVLNHHIINYVLETKDMMDQCFKVDQRAMPKDVEK